MNNKCRRESIKAELTQFIEGQTHKSHCCILHGCKYGEKECPVVIGDIEQEEICEYCGIEGIKAVEELQEVRSQRIGVNELPPVKKDLQLFVLSLDDNLKQGIKLAEGLYKVRIKNSDNNKGKSAGYRIITYALIEDELFLVDIYSKSEMENIANEAIDLIVKQYKKEN